MGLGWVFSNTWKDYKTNFWTNKKVMVVFYLLPMLIVLGIGVGLFYYMGLAQDAAPLFGKLIEIQDIKNAALTGTADMSNQLLQLETEFIELIRTFLAKIFLVLLAIFILEIVAWFVSMYGLVAVFAPSLKKKGKYGFKEAVKIAKPYYWRYVGFILLMCIFGFAMFIGCFIEFVIADFLLGSPGLIIGIIGLFVVLFVVLIWLSIIWVFAPYVIADMNKGVFASMGESRRIVKGRWWRIVGYLLLVGITIGLVSGIVYSIVNSVVVLVVITSSYFSSPINMYVTLKCISVVLSAIVSVFALPYALLFGKNMYLSFKKEKH